MALTLSANTGNTVITAKSDRGYVQVDWAGDTQKLIWVPKLTDPSGKVWNLTSNDGATAVYTLAS